MKLRCLLSGLAAFLLLVSCDEVPEPLPTLTLKSRVVEFDASAGSAQIPVESSADWTVTADTACSSWLSVEKQSGMFVVSVSANEDLNEREGSVSVTAGPKTMVVNVIQGGILLCANLSENSASFTVDGGTLTVDIDASVDWRFESSDSWITADMSRGSAGKGKVVLSVAPNDDFTAREGTAGFYFGMKKLGAVAISQDPFVVSTSLDRKNVEASTDGETVSISYTTNYAWTAVSDSWLTVAPASGEASTTAQTVTVTVPEATSIARSGNVVFTSGNVRDTVVFHQEKAVPKTMTVVMDLWNGSKHDAKLVFKETIVASAASSVNQGVKTLSLKEYEGLKLEYYSSGKGPLMNGTSGLMTCPYIAAGSTSNAIRETEAFAYIKFPAIPDLKLDKVEVRGPNVASDKVFNSYITTTYGNSNEEAKAAKVSDVMNMSRGVVTTYNIKGAVVNTPYYLFMEPNGGTSNADTFLISCITLTYNPAL